MSSKILHDQYYFAFGSNMSLAQMAERCPGSTFIGKATLRGYRWQINQRHVANIVKAVEEPPTARDVVEGLVFSITDKDRRTLDRKEGIKLGVYERVILGVLLERHPTFAEKKTAFVRDRLPKESNAISPPADHEGATIESRQKNPAIANGSETGENAVDLGSRPSVLSKKRPAPIKDSAPKLEEIEAITYLSTKYTDNGLIRHEYVQRMENAISDAVKLNVSLDFVKMCLHPYVHGDVYQPEESVQKKASTPTSTPSSSQPVPKEGKEKGKSGSALNTAASQPAQSQSPVHKVQTKRKVDDSSPEEQPQQGEDKEKAKTAHRLVKDNS